MIEEFQDWLVRKHKVAPDIAEMMHDAAYKGDEEGLRSVAIDGEFDGDEMVELYRGWQLAVGERTIEHPTECRYCGKHCYEIEASDEGSAWRKDDEPCYLPEWRDTFRLCRSCDEYDPFDDEEHRTDWHRSMQAAIKDWNKQNAT